MNKKFHILYKTTCLVNYKYYIGVHNTNNLDDGYLGSGKLLQFAVRKYGVSNFKREILYFFKTAEEAFQAESQVLTDSILKDPNCYNLQPGGRNWKGVPGKIRQIYLQKKLKILPAEVIQERKEKTRLKRKKMGERQRGLNNPETKKKFEVYKQFFTPEMKYLYEETTAPDWVLELMFMGKGFARYNPTRRFIEAGFLKKPVGTVWTDCCTFQQKQKKTIFCEKPRECIILDVFENKDCQNIRRRFEHLPDLLSFSKNLQVSNSMLINGKTSYKCEMSDARWFIRRGVLTEELINIKVQAVNNRVLTRVPKSIFKLTKNEIIIIDKELSQYEIDEFGRLYRVGEFKKG